MPLLDDYGFLPVDGIESLDELAERVREAHLSAVEADADLDVSCLRADEAAPADAATSTGA